MSFFAKNYDDVGSSRKALALSQTYCLYIYYFVHRNSTVPHSQRHCHCRLSNSFENTFTPKNERENVINIRVCNV